jgi:hypothetical protein
MNARRPAPIGPLAIALRHLRSPSRRRLIGLGIGLGIALLAGVALLLIR